MDLPTTHYDKPAAQPPEKKEETPSGSKKSGAIFEKASLYVFLATLFLAPLAFIPSAYTTLDLVKTAVIAFGMLASFILYGIAMLRDRKFSMLKGSLVYASLAIMLSLIISTFHSSNFWKSFIGQGFEIGSTSFLLLLFCTAFFVGRLTSRHKERVFNIYAAIFIAFIILALFQIARIIGGPDFMTLGILTSLASSVIGKWYDFAILTALVGLLSLFGLKFLSPGKGLKILLSIVLAVSALFLYAIDFSILWWVVAAIALGLGAYEYRAAIQQKFWSRFSILTVIILVVAIACAWKGDTIARPVTSALGLTQGELILPWQSTIDITAATIKQEPLFGVGPNRFGVQFLKFKPSDINLTPFWTAEFTLGVGQVPSFIVTQGIIGGILWLLFFIFFIRLGILALRRAHDPFKKFFAASSFFGASLLWLINILYIPSHVILFLTFVFTGLFFAALAGEGLLVYHELGVRPRSKKYLPIIASLALVVAVVWFGFYLKKTVGLAYFQSGIKVLNVSNNPDAAQAQFKKALAWDTSDVYYQALSETDLLKINTLAGQLQSSANSSASANQAAAQQIATLVNEALGYSRKAIAIDPTNYYNYIAEAHVSEIASTLQIPNSYKDGKASYLAAANIDPTNPAIYLNLARLDASQSDFTDAEQDVGKALQLKPNYTDAVFLLSQIQVASGDLKNAIISSQVATELNPSDPTLLFELGFLQYTNQDYADAATALAKAVALNDQYANARYFLGLADVRLGKNADAIAQFQELAKTNPDNKEVAFILSNLQEGNSPFADAQPPIDSKPEKRATLPLKDTSSDSGTSATD